jgi:hypothetical protein
MLAMCILGFLVNLFSKLVLLDFFSIVITLFMIVFSKLVLGLYLQISIVFRLVW